MAANGAGVFFDLDGQLARRRQDQRARVFGPALGQRRARQQAVEHRHQKRRGLAGTGLRLTGDIVSGQCHGQAQCLDRRAAGEAAISETLRQRGMQIELLEKRISKDLIGHDLNNECARGAP